MIVIYCGNEILHSDSARGFANALAPILTEEINKVPVLTLQIVVGNPCYEAIKQGDIITAEEDGKIIFRGRVDKITLTFNRNKKIESAGEFTFFNDSIIRPFETFTGTIRDALEELIEAHNACADSDKQYSVGEVDSQEEHAFTNEKHCTVMAYLQDSILGAYGGQIYFDTVAGSRRINYRSQPETAEQSIRYGDNMIDLTSAADQADLFTVLVPIGRDGLTIETLTGRDYVENQEAVAVYGKRWRVEEFDTDSPQELLQQAQERVAEAPVTIPTVTLKAFDLANLGTSIERFQVGQKVTVYSAVHGVDLSLTVNKISRDLLTPTGSYVTIGEAKKGMVSQVRSAEKQLEKKAGSGATLPIKRTDLADDVQQSLNSFDSLGLSVINGKVYDSWEE